MVNKIEEAIRENNHLVRAKEANKGMSDIELGRKRTIAIADFDKNSSIKSVDDLIVEEI